MDDNKIQRMENELIAMRAASEKHHRDMERVMSKMQETLTNIAVILEKLTSLEKRTAKLEEHESAREVELKESFSRRDDKLMNIARIVYIGMGIILAIQAIGVIKGV